MRCEFEILPIKGCELHISELRPFVEEMRAKLEAVAHCPVEIWLDGDRYALMGAF